MNSRNQAQSLLRNRVGRLLLCVLLTFGVFVNITTIPVYAASAVCDITITKQEKSLWCWASASQAIGASISGVRKTQSAIVSHVKGNTDNVAAPLNQGATACNFASSFQRTYSYLGYSRTSGSGRWSYAQIQGSISSSHAVYAAAAPYSGSTRGTGHAVVIYAYNTSGSTLSYGDPADGYYRICTYTAFCDGSYNGRQYDGTVF